VPYLLAVSMASISGHRDDHRQPADIMIGSFSQIPYTKFALALGLGRTATADHHCALSRSSSRRVRPAPRDWQAAATEGHANPRAGYPAFGLHLSPIALFFAGVVRQGRDHH